MRRATSVANASSELRRAYSRTRTMSSVGILPIHLRRREKVTDYFYGRLMGNSHDAVPVFAPAPVEEISSSFPTGARGRCRIKRERNRTLSRSRAGDHSVMGLPRAPTPVGERINQ